ncbi:MAG: TolC family protein [Bacteroidia bacterium]|nr:TolC family protein [Bacteroidia bacterium]
MKYALMLALLFAIPRGVKAMDTLTVSIKQADSTFLKNNLLLLAGQLNISANQALQIQARVWPGPTITFDLNAFDPDNQRYFHTGPTGQKAAQFEQLLLTAGKRKFQILLAATNTEISRQELIDLLRELRYQLYLNYFEVFQQMQMIKVFDKQLIMLDELVTTYTNQAKEGNITMKEVIRLKAAYFSLNNDKALAQNKLIESQQKIRTILMTDAFVLPVSSEPWLSNINSLPTVNTLLDSALSQRPDLKLASLNRQYNQFDLKLQQRQRFPDVNLIGSYDQRGGAFTNQLNVGISFTLPAWNLNKGNIQHAFNRVNIADNTLKATQQETRSEVIAAWESMNTSLNQYNKITRFYSSDFDELIEGMNENFKKRNISMLEFVDFFEAYISAESEYERVRAQLAFSAANINYVTSSSIY